MSVLNLVVVLVVIGALLWALNAFVPMDAKIKKILNVVVVVLVLLWVLSAFGLYDPFAESHVPKILK